MHLRTPDGRKSYTAQYPQTMTAADQKIEIDDLVTSWESMATQIAKTQYYKAGLHYDGRRAGVDVHAEGTGRMAAAGTVHRDLLPQQHRRDHCSLSGYGAPYTYDLVGWLTESITWEWGRQGAFRSWSATVKCRRYWR